MTICPKCKDRATKLYNLNTGEYTCQKCGHKWTLTEPRTAKGSLD